MTVLNRRERARRRIARRAVLTDPIPDDTDVEHTTRVLDGTTHDTTCEEQ